MTSSAYDKLYSLYLQRTGQSPVEPSDLKITIKSVLRILDSWGLSTDQSYAALGCSSLNEIWAKQESVDDDLCFRSSLLLGIYADLRRCFLQDAHQLEWLQNKNKSLNSLSPIILVSSGDIYGLSDVRALLSAYLI